MYDSGQRTEKPTPRRREKARKDGQFPVSREFVSAVQFAIFVAVLGRFGTDFLGGLQQLMRALVDGAFTSRELTPSECRRLFHSVAAPVFLPLLYAGASLVTASAGTHLAVTQLGFATKNLKPDFSRLSP